MDDMTTTGGQTIIDVFAADIVGITHLLQRLETTPDSFDRQVEAARLVREIVEYHVAAEQYLLPLIDDHLGKDASHREFQQHRSLEGALRRLEGLEAATPAFAAALRTVNAEWIANGRRLNDEIFPALGQQCSTHELRSQLDDVLATKAGAPTRPRTIAVEEPAANRLISLAQGYVDKAIDAVTHRGREGSLEIDERIESGRYNDLEA
jgi:hypothetical protein